jgi:hypothetical protein
LTTQSNDQGNEQTPPQPLPVNVPLPPIPPLVAATSDSGSLKAFLSLTGGSILYCLSALAIICGISESLGPVLLKSKSLSEGISCFAALNVYELALLGVLIMIVVWRNVTDDAISLVVLIALFLIASGATLGTIAYQAPFACLFIGVGATAVGLGKLYAMRRFISLKLPNLAFLGMGLILVWNFLTSSVISKSMVAHTDTDAGRRLMWLSGWLVLLAGAVLILIEAARTRSNDEKENTSPAFLYTPLMTWVFALVLLAAAYAHQYAIAYMFVVDHAFGDYIPLIGMISLLLLELASSEDRPDSTFTVFITCVPLVLAFIALMSKSMIAPSKFGIELLWYAPVMLALIGLGILWLSLRHNLRELRYIAAAYALFVLLTADYVPRNLETLHWHLVGVGVVAILLFLGAIHKSIALCLLSVIGLAIGLPSAKAFQNIISALSLTPEGSFVGIIGLGTLLICLFFGRKTPKLLVVFGAISTSFLALDLLLDQVGWQVPASTAVIAVLCVLLWFRNRSIAAIVLLCIPSLVRFYMLGNQMAHWRWIILSFILLFLGALSSLYKGKNINKNSAQSPPQP